jgi:excisionase family DNA binding protein
MQANPRLTLPNGGFMMALGRHRKEMAVEALLTRAEVAELMKVPTSTLHQWASQGKGPTYLIVGRHSRYRLRDVERWLEGQAREAGVRS